jgi:hypothetical protein
VAERGQGFVRTLSKKAAAPLMTAAAAYLARKAGQVWQEKLQPKIKERGGGGTAVRELIEPASEKLKEAASKVGDAAPDVLQQSTPSSSISSQKLEAHRRQRAQRRQERRRALEQSGPS